MTLPHRLLLGQGNYTVYLQLSNWLGYVGTVYLPVRKLPDTVGPVPQLIINGPYVQVRCFGFGAAHTDMQVSIPNASRNLNFEDILKHYRQRIKMPNIL